MDIARNIKRFRQQKDLTQEQLAERIGCSAKTVSKWERGDGYPDISFIPLLANVLNVSTDELFGMDAKRREERLKEYRRRLRAYLGTGLRYDGVPTVYYQGGVKPDAAHAAVLEIAREGLREFAGDLEAEMLIAQYLYFVPEAKREAIAIYERVLVRSTDDKLRLSARQDLIRLLADAGELERARETAKMLPFWSVTSEDQMLATITEGRERVGHAQRALKTGLIKVCGMLDVLIAARDGDAFIYGTEDRLKLLDIKIMLNQFLYRNSANKTVFIDYFEHAEFFAEIGDLDRAVEYIEKAAEFSETQGAVLLDEAEEENVLFTEAEAYDDISDAPRKAWMTARMGWWAVLGQLGWNPVLGRLNHSEIQIRPKLAPILDDPRIAAVIERMRKLEAEFNAWCASLDPSAP